MSVIKKGVLGLVLAIMFPAISQADTAISFSGNLTIPLCTVNNNAEVKVDFKDIEIQTLVAADKAYSIKEFSVPVNCPYTIGTPSITVNSSAIHNATNGVLQTSKYSEGLVVYMLKKDATTALPIGAASDISQSMTGTGNNRTLTLNAGVGRIGELDTLTAGTFTASATMQVSYQ